MPDHDLNDWNLLVDDHGPVHALLHYPDLLASRADLQAAMIKALEGEHFIKGEMEKLLDKERAARLGIEE